MSYIEVNRTVKRRSVNIYRDLLYAGGQHHISGSGLSGENVEG